MKKKSIAECEFKVCKLSTSFLRTRDHDVVLKRQKRITKQSQQKESLTLIILLYRMAIKKMYLRNLFYCA